MKKNSKNGVLTTIIIFGIILIMLNVCTFAIPFNKINLSVHFITYGCTEFLIVYEMILIISHLFFEEDKNQKIIGLPIIYFGYITLIIQLFVAIIIYYINAFVNLPIWIVIVIECFIIGLGIIQIIRASFFKTRNLEYHKNMANTKFMDEFRARLKALQMINKNKNLEKILDDLVDTALGSDPITNDKTLDSESELLSLLQELDENIKSGSEEDSRITIEKAKNALLERNVLCKTGK